MKSRLLIFIFFISILEAGTILEDPAFQSIYAKPENGDKKVLMFYSAESCPQCAYMKEKVFTEQEVKAYMDRNLVVLHKDINTDTLPEGFDYFGIPTMFFIDKNGKMITKIIGSSRAKPFLARLRTILEGER